MADEQTTDYEAQAREIGWVPQADWKGPAENWVDAREFVERGRTYIPFLKRTTEQQAQELETLRAQQRQTDAALKAAQATIDALEETTTELTETVRTDTLADLKVALKGAREAGDIDSEIEILGKIREAQAPVEKKPAATTERPAGTQPNGNADPAFAAWGAANPWFGSDEVRTATAMGVASALRKQGNKDAGRPFWDAVTRETNKRLGITDNANRERPSSVEGDGGGSRETGGGGGNGKTYADLPPEAKAACERQIPRLVGPGKKHKDAASWRAAYLAKYQW